MCDVRAFWIFRAHATIQCDVQEESDERDVCDTHMPKERCEKSVA